ncbi:MAG: endonuclease/exonuclease/phosphatase family protein [Planctomycetota bacterium]|nr:endonuclease/exonuclease/phosphatase family protein [Planctomycetota bacterium]
MSWNVQHKRDEGSHPRRHQWVADTISAHQPAVCCLQEVGLALRGNLPQLLPQYRIYGADTCAERGAESVPVLVHHDAGAVVEARTFWIGSDPSSPLRAWDARHPRCATAVKIAGITWDLSVVSCHLDHRGRRARLLGAGQLAQWAVEHRPAVIAGDLNAGPGNPAYQALVGPPPRLQDTRLSANAVSGPAATWTSGHGLLRRRLDHLLVDHQLIVRNHRTLDGPPGRKPISDHRPILAEVTGPNELP